MAKSSHSTLPEIISSSQDRILADWTQQQQSAIGRNNPGREAEVREQSREFLDSMKAAFLQGADVDINSTEWRVVREFIENLSRTRARQGSSPTETAMFIFSLKEAIFNAVRDTLAKDPEKMVAE